MIPTETLDFGEILCTRLGCMWLWMRKTVTREDIILFKCLPLQAGYPQFRLNDYCLLQNMYMYSI